MRDATSSRRGFLGGCGARLGVLLACCSSGDRPADATTTAPAAEAGDGGSSPARTATPTDTTADGGWRETQLTDVLSGETFSIAGIGQPVVLESFAVWCPVCTRQQRQLAELSETGSDAAIVSLNTDPNEDADRVRTHAEEHGFDWRYAVAPASMSQALVAEFGRQVIRAPAAPVVVICPDGTAAFLSERAVKPAERLRTAVRSC